MSTVSQFNPSAEERRKYLRLIIIGAVVSILSLALALAGFALLTDEADGAPVVMISVGGVVLAIGATVLYCGLWFRLNAIGRYELSLEA